MINEKCDKEKLICNYFIHVALVGMCRTRNTGTGNGMWGTQRTGECYIPGNVAKHSEHPGESR